jgi:hypothetical protein
MALIHRSFEHERTKYPHGSGPVEKAFADAWEKENKEQPGVNYGMGILQDLMVVPSKNWGIFGWHKMRANITPEKAQIVATVIQWLGTNVGFCWLEKTLNDAGYQVRGNRDIAAELKQAKERIAELEAELKRRDDEELDLQKCIAEIQSMELLAEVSA